MAQPNEPGPGAASQDTPEPGASATQDPNEPVDISSLPANVQKMISTLRAENASARSKARQTAAQQARTEVLQQIGQALGITEGTPDPNELTAQLTRSQEDAASAQLELQVYRTATRLGADADRLLDSRSFCDKVDNLDPEKDFGEQVEALIKQEMERSGGASRTRTDFDGGARTSADKPADMNQIIRQAAGLGR